MSVKNSKKLQCKILTKKIKVKNFIKYVYLMNIKGKTVRCVWIYIKNQQSPICPKL